MSALLSVPAKLKEMDKKSRIILRILIGTNKKLINGSIFLKYKNSYFILKNMNNSYYENILEN